MLKIIIVGCNGKMGQILSETLKESQEMAITAGIDRTPDKYVNPFAVFKHLQECPEKADAIIDFSHPSHLPEILAYGMLNKTPLVLATTGYTGDDVKKINDAASFIPIFLSPNLSYGICLMKTMLQDLMRLAGDEYDVEIIEKHHNQKSDAPSGTALLLASAINEAAGNDYHYVYGRHGTEAKRSAKEIGIHALRGGTIPGEHTVILAGNDETIEIKHTAYSKKVFAEGAVRAAKFICGKAPGLYSMNDLIHASGDMHGK